MKTSTIGVPHKRCNGHSLLSHFLLLSVLPPPTTTPYLTVTLIIQGNVVGAFKKEIRKLDYTINYPGLWTQIWHWGEQGDGWMFGRMKDDEVKRAVLLPLSVHLLLSSHTQIYGIKRKRILWTVYLSETLRPSGRRRNE